MGYGNDRIGNYDYMPLLRVDNTVWNNTIQVGQKLRTILGTRLEMGNCRNNNFIDLSVFQNRIQLNLDYYINKTKDLLFNTCSLCFRF